MAFQVLNKIFSSNILISCMGYNLINMTYLYNFQDLWASQNKNV